MTLLGEKQIQETHEQHSPYVARGAKASVQAPALPGRGVLERWPLLDVVYLPAAEIPALRRFIGLHVPQHLRVEIHVHAGSESRHGEKNSQKSE